MSMTSLGLWKDAKDAHSSTWHFPVLSPQLSTSYLEQLLSKLFTVPLSGILESVNKSRSIPQNWPQLSCHEKCANKMINIDICFKALYCSSSFIHSSEFINSFPPIHQRPTNTIHSWLHHIIVNWTIRLINKTRQFCCWTKIGRCERLIPMDTIKGRKACFISFFSHKKVSSKIKIHGFKPTI